MSIRIGRKTLTEWLLDNAPASRRQAAWGRAYRGWRQFRRNRLAMAGLIGVVALVLASICAPMLATHDPSSQNLASRLAAPSGSHWLGTDELGRDLYSRLLYGGRATLGIVLAVAYLELAMGQVWWLAPIATTAIGLGFYMLHNTLQTNATQMTPQARGTAVGLFSSALYVGQTAGVAAGAVVIDRAGAPPLFLATAIALPVLAIWFVRELKRFRRVD